MLIVCPNCATSYEIDPAALGEAGRTVRCARCQTTWFAGGAPEPQMASFVDDVITDAEARLAGEEQAMPPQPAGEAALPAESAPPAADDFGEEAAQPIAALEADTPSGDDEASAEEPKAIDDAPSLLPPEEHPPLTAPADDDADTGKGESENYVARRERLAARRKQSRRSSRWTVIALALFAANVALIGAREDVVRYLPQTAPLFSAIGLPVNLRHLKFENVKILKDIKNGANVLIVEGTIVSTAGKAVAVPRLRFAARDAAGQEIYTWTAMPSRRVLGPGEHLNFRSRLASPPADATTVMVRFLDSHDAAGVTK